MPTYLPLFPLNLIAFPGEELRLYIFEPRYRQLIEECIGEGKHFGILTLIEGDMTSVATEMKVVSMDKRFSAGEMNITSKGIQRAKVLDFDKVAPGKLYPGGKVEFLEDEGIGDLPLQQKIFALMVQLHDALGISKKICDSPDSLSSFLIGHHLGLSLSQKVEMLGMNEEKNRLLFIQDHLEKVIPIIKETERLKAKARLNGHYKNIVPPKF